MTEFYFQLDFDWSDNRAKYEALIIGFEILVKLRAQNVCILGDSQLMIRQLNTEYNCMSESLIAYHVWPYNY